MEKGHGLWQPCLWGQGEEMGMLSSLRQGTAHGNLVSTHWAAACTRGHAWQRHARGGTRGQWHDVGACAQVWTSVIFPAPTHMEAGEGPRQPLAPAPPAAAGGEVLVGG